MGARPLVNTNEVGDLGGTGPACGYHGYKYSATCSTTSPVRKQGVGVAPTDTEEDSSPFRHKFPCLLGKKLSASSLSPLPTLLLRNSFSNSIRTATYNEEAGPQE